MITTDIQLLRKTIDDKGMPIAEIARRIGIARETLHNKISGETEFKASEIVALSDVLCISNALRDKIFLTKNVN